VNENTFTFTARSIDNPDKVATFTLQNGHVSVELGSAMMEQVERVFDAFDGTESSRLISWLEPAAAGALRKVEQPIPLADFEADIHGERMQATAWLRAGGLRLAPIMATWKQVDNPAGAQAFVNELHDRREMIAESDRRPALFDYWISWVAAGLMSITLPLIWWRLWLRHRQAASQ
jgi:hypothetical protein